MTTKIVLLLILAAQEGIEGKLDEMRKNMATRGDVFVIERRIQKRMEEYSREITERLFILEKKMDKLTEKLEVEERERMAELRRSKEAIERVIGVERQLEILRIAGLVIIILFLVTIVVSLRKGRRRRSVTL